MGEQTVVIVGAGPRGTSVMERLIARYAAYSGSEQRPLAIHLVDPYPAGPGHVWRTEQSRLYLMNTPSFFPTLIPDRGVDVPALAGLTFDRWRAVQRSTPSDELSEGDRAELAGLTSSDFPSRALYGRYLRWTFARLVDSAPHGVTIHTHATNVARVARERANAGFAVVLHDGETLAAEDVVLALGHLPSQLSPAQEQLAAEAKAAGLAYWPPAVPNDVDWDLVPAGEVVLVRGMGLNFFDVVGQLTEGRGGRFESSGNGAGDALVYVASGREPRIVAASRRGVPYRAKAELDSYYPASIQLRFLGEDAVAAIRAMGATAGFDHDIWPLLHRDTVWAYYATLARTRPQAISKADFLARLDQVLAIEVPDEPRDFSGPLQALVAECVEASCRLDLPALARPLAGRSFATHQELDETVLDYLRADAASSAAGEDDAVKMAIGALNAGRAVIKSLVADRGITEESWLGELRGWFEGFVEGLASGPPALRTEQLAALVRAGVVHFVGPDPVFRVEDGLFRADSPWVRDEPWFARHLVEALAPANRVQTSDSGLMRGLLEDGLVRPRIMLAADGEPVVTSGLDVSAPPYRPLDGAGRPVDGLYVIGLQLSSVQWGTAIASQAGAAYRSGYRTVLDSDAIARSILGQ